MELQSSHKLFPYNTSYHLHLFLVANRNSSKSWSLSLSHSVSHWVFLTSFSQSFGFGWYRVTKGYKVGLTKPKLRLQSWLDTANNIKLFQINKQFGNNCPISMTSRSVNTKYTLQINSAINICNEYSIFTCYLSLWSYSWAQT